MMRAEIWAVLTAACWAVGSTMEKRGVNIGNLSPVTGSVVRTFFSLLVLFFLSLPLLGQLKDAGPKSILLIAVGGGLLSGGLGIVFLYTGLKSGNISTVMTIAFCLAPVIGAVIGYFLLKERLSPMQIAGVILCITGAVMTVYFRD
jgi:uncharacterized membrane protein